MRLQSLHPSFGLLAAIALLLVSFLLSLQIGIADVTPAQVLAAFLWPEGRFSDLVVLTERLPRSGMAVAVGASLATAEVLLQGLTQNPLAAPSLLGVNAGAALGVVAATSLEQRPCG